MKIKRIYNDEYGKSYFGEVEILFVDGGFIGLLFEKYGVGKIIFCEMFVDYDFKWYFVLVC